MRIFGNIESLDEATRSVRILASTPKPVQGDALVSWDLERYQKNPVLLWMHDPTQAPIGRVEDIEVDDDGLKGTAVFATAEANPFAEQCFQLIKEGMLRAVSVGFEIGEEAGEVSAEGETGTARKRNELIEISFVTVPADEDAGIEGEMHDGGAPSDGERTFGNRHRRRAYARVSKRMDAATTLKLVHRFDDGEEYSRLGKCERTQLGGARIKARLTRTGILTYRDKQTGEVLRRELRLPEEVFNADSLATLESAPVIDIRDHVELVTPETYRKVALGTVRAVRKDGEYVESELFVQDAATLDAIDRGERTEISCGYTCRLDETPGVYEGEPYDAVQRHIRYNHVALCPPNRGRAGPEVGLRLDANSQQKEKPMADKVIKLDGKEYQYGSEAHFDKIEAMHKAELAALQKRLDEADGAKDEAKEAAQKARDNAEKDKQAAEEERKRSGGDFAERVKRTVRLLRQRDKIDDEIRELDPDSADQKAREGEEDPDKKKDDEMKMDALSERDLKVAILKKLNPKFSIVDVKARFDSTDKNIEQRVDDYISARFDTAIENHEARLKEHRSIHGVTRTAIINASRFDNREERNDADDDVETKAIKERDDALANAWKPGAKKGAA